MAYFFAAVATLAVIHLALDWRDATLVETRDALRLEVAREQSRTLKRHSTPTAATGEVGLADTSQVALRLRRVAAAVPDDLWLTGYNERRGEIAMRGMVSNHDAPRIFVENLAAAKVFGPLEIVETARRPGSDGKRMGTAGVEEFSLRTVLGTRAGAVDKGGSGS
jgi:hypothetical protein